MRFFRTEGPVRLTSIESEFGNSALRNFPLYFIVETVAILVVDAIQVLRHCRGQKNWRAGNRALRRDRRGVYRQ
jgi:hypothetical protein